MRFPGVGVVESRIVLSELKVFVPLRGGRVADHGIRNCHMEALEKEWIARS